MNEEGLLAVLIVCATIIVCCAMFSHGFGISVSHGGYGAGS